MNPKILFLGNHTVGVRVLKTLHQHSCLYGVVAHPDDHEDGTVYQSVYEQAKALRVPVIRAMPKDQEFLSFLHKIAPNLIWVTDYRYLLPKEIFSIPKYGAINLHPSLLPHYRGRASLNWALIHGEKEVGLTAHFIEEGVDTGDIVTQIVLPIEENDYIGDVLDKMYPLYEAITTNVVQLFGKGNVARERQDTSKGSIYPARKPKDGLIDVSKNAYETLNFVRALSKPYPGAFLMHENKKIIIWKAELSTHTFEKLGIKEFCGKKYLQCTDMALEIMEYDIEEID